MDDLDRKIKKLEYIVQLNEKILEMNSIKLNTNNVENSMTKPKCKIINMFPSERKNR